MRLFERAVNDGGAAARRRIGFLSHQSFLYPDLTPTENLDFYARMFRVSKPVERVRALIERVGLTGWAHRPVRTLSRGLEQRCALARALVHEPDLLLLDEPFTGLDVDASGMLAGMLRETHASGTTLLMTTHDMARGLELCRRAIILARGRLDVGRHALAATSSCARRSSATYAAAAQRHVAGRRLWPAAQARLPPCSR